MKTEILNYLEIANNLAATFSIRPTTILTPIKVKMTAYHLRTSGKVKIQNRTLVSWPGLYMAFNQLDWDMVCSTVHFHVQLSAYRSTNVSPLSLPVTQYPPGPVIIDSLTSLPTDTLTSIAPKALCGPSFTLLATMLPKVPQKLRQNDCRYKCDFDWVIRTMPKFLIGQFLYVDHPSLITLNTASNSENYKKTLLRAHGLFRIQRITEPTIAVDDNGVP